jgi:hypothetical protein
MLLSFVTTLQDDLQKIVATCESDDVMRCVGFSGMLVHCLCMINHRVTTVTKSLSRLNDNYNNLQHDIIYSHRLSHRCEQKLRDFAPTTLGMYICIREYSNQTKFNTFLFNHLSEIGPVEMI